MEHMIKTTHDCLPVNSSIDRIISINGLDESDSLTRTCKRCIIAEDDRLVRPESVLKDTGKLAASSTVTHGYRLLIYIFYSSDF